LLTRPYLAHELEPGRQYSIVITTGGGLYRYQLHDWVEVTGYLGTCPLLCFAGKEASISDWFGEKLNERHVSQALAKLFAHYAIQPVFAMVAGDEGGTLSSSGFAYTLFIEAPLAADEMLKRLGYDLETALQENYHYRYCRELGQLGPLQLFRIETGALAAYLSFCQSHGQRAGDIKPVALHRLSGWAQVFRGQRVE